MDTMIAYFVNFQEHWEDGGYNKIVAPFKIDGCMDGYGSALE